MSISEQQSAQCWQHDSSCGYQAQTLPSLSQSKLATFVAVSGNTSPDTHTPGHTDTADNNSPDITDNSEDVKQPDNYQSSHYHTSYQQYFIILWTQKVHKNHVFFIKLKLYMTHKMYNLMIQWKVSIMKYCNFL